MNITKLGKYEPIWVITINDKQYSVHNLDNPIVFSEVKRQLSWQTEVTHYSRRLKKGALFNYRVEATKQYEAENPS
jgi:hypothetical protein